MKFLTAAAAGATASLVARAAAVRRARRVGHGQVGRLFGGVQTDHYPATAAHPLSRRERHLLERAQVRAAQPEQFRTLSIHR